MGEETTVDSLAQRIGSIEKRQRHTALGLSVLALLLLSAMTGAIIRAHTRTVEVDRLVVRDKDDRQRIVAGTVDGHSTLTLYDNQGKNGIQLIVTDKGPAFTLYDDDGVPRTMITLAPDGPAILLNDTGRKVAAYMSVTTDGSNLTMRDAHGISGS